LPELYPLSLHDALPIWRRVAGRLLARHHRPGSLALRPLVRALPESGARIDARLRHRLLRARARPGDRVREAEVRGAVGLADRDLDRKSTRLNSSHVAIS